MYDDGYNAAPKVSIPRTVSTDISRGRTSPTAPQQSARAARFTATNTSDRPTTAASARGDVTAPSSAQAERSQFVESGDARGAARVHPASASSRGGGTPTTPQSPPGLRQPAPSSRQGNGRQRDRGRSESTGGSSTLSDHRSTGGPGGITASQSPSVSPEPHSPISVSRFPTAPPGIFHPSEGGFPTHADTEWGDPIAVAQASSTRKKSTTSISGTSSAPSRSAVDVDIDWQTTGGYGRGNVEVGQEELVTRTGRGRRANRRGGRRGTVGKTTTAVAGTTPGTSQPQDVAHPNVLDVVLPPGGPGTHWSNEDVKW